MDAVAELLEQIARTLPPDRPGLRKLKTAAAGRTA